MPSQNYNSNATQAIALLNLPVKVAQDTPKGTWVTATGGLVATGEAPIGVTQADAKQGEMVAITVIGTASMNLAGIAVGAVKQGDLVIIDGGVLQIVSANTYATNVSKLLGVVLYDANPNGHAEVLIR